MCLHFTEFGSFTVGESGEQSIRFVPKQQNDRENGI
jgi:hypothetical protein